MTQPYLDGNGIPYLDWNYYKPTASVESLEKGIVAALLEEGINISDEVKEHMKKVLVQGRGNGRLAHINREQDAEGMANYLQRNLQEIVNGTITDLNLPKKQAELLCDIALMTFKVGYERPHQDAEPEFYKTMINLIR